MAKSSYDFEKEFMSTIVDVTGKSLKDWMRILKDKGLSRQKETTDWLKKEKGFNHLQASLLAGIFVNGGNPVYADTNELLDSQFAGKEHLKSLFDHIIKMIKSTFKDVQIIPKKTYVSISGKREFAAIAIKSKEIRLGMDLGDMPFDNRISAAKSLGAMPRISHMLQLTDKQQCDNTVIDLLKKANERVNG